MATFGPVMTCFVSGLRTQTQSAQPVLLCASNACAQKLLRHAHSQTITENMRYISNDKAILKLDPTTMRLEKERNKPLCIIMNWMLAKPQHVMKYASLYLEQGFDVVSVSCTPWQLMWPVKGAQLIGADLMRFISENGHKPLVMHGFSVGAYVWGEALVFAMNDKEKYQPVLDKMAVQVWDSAADITEIPVGFPSAVFPKNMFLQNTLRRYTKYHLNKFHEAATKHYLRSSDIFHQTPCKAPALFLLSRTDPVGAETSNRGVHDCWRNLGMKCTWQCWDRSPHVLHYFHHPQEYRALLFRHLDENGLVTNPEKMRERLAS